MKRIILSLIFLPVLLSGQISITSNGGIVPVTRGGTGLSAFGGTNTVLFTTAANTLTSSSKFTWDNANSRLFLGPDASNNYSTTVGAAGSVTFDAAGASAGFVFADGVYLGTGSAQGLFSNTGFQYNTGSYSAAFTPRTGSGVFSNVFGNGQFEVYSNGGSGMIVGTGAAIPFGIGTNNALVGVFTAGGLFGIGTGSTATAYCHIKAGTTSAAQIRLAAGVAPSSPNDGDAWYEDTNDRLQFRQNATTVEIIGASAVNTVSPTSPDRTITIKINGVTYYLHAKTTND